MARSKDSTPSGHVNLRMLAEHLELSQTTVSLVLNNSPSAKSIPQETRNRVLEAATRLNYRPNYFARSLRQSRSMSVGVLAPDLSEGYFTRVMSGVVQELTEAHYFYFTACHDWKQRTHRAVSAHARRARRRRLPALEHACRSDRRSGPGRGNLRPQRSTERHQHRSRPPQGGRNRARFTSTNSAIAASPSCAARAPFPTPNFAGRASSR